VPFASHGKLHEFGAEKPISYATIIVTMTQTS
jgi:hypothetical protein